MVGSVTEKSLSTSFCNKSFKTRPIQIFSFLYDRNGMKVPEVDPRRANFALATGNSILN